MDNLGEVGSPPTPSNARDLAEEYIQIVNDLRAACIESWIGLPEILKGVAAQERAELTAIAKRRGRPILDGEFDDHPVIFSPDPPWSPNARVYLSVPKSDFRARNTKGGVNSTLISNSCLTSMYQYWEDYYRGKLAAALGVPEGTLKADAFGELRILRRSIIHNRGRAIPEVRKCVLFPWFKPGDPIRFGIDQLNTIASSVSRATLELIAAAENQ